MMLIPYIVILILGILAYAYSVSTRKFYVCPECGEKYKTEHMTASHCNCCGTKFPDNY